MAHHQIPKVSTLTEHLLSLLLLTVKHKVTATLLNTAKSRTTNMARLNRPWARTPMLRSLALVTRVNTSNIHLLHKVNTANNNTHHHRVSMEVMSKVATANNPHRNHSTASSSMTNITVRRLVTVSSMDRNMVDMEDSNSINSIPLRLKVNTQAPLSKEATDSSTVDLVDRRVAMGDIRARPRQHGKEGNTSRLMIAVFG
jgi:hypothetical protein